MKTLKIFLIFFLFYGFQTPAQEKDYSKEPGYFDFSKIMSLKTSDDITEIYLEESMLKILSGISNENDEDLSKAIGGLKLIRVNEFMIDNDQKSKYEFTMQSFDKDLQNQKWERIIKSKSSGTHANVYVKKVTDNKFAGLVVMALDKEGKATLVNIVGNVDLKTIGKLSKEFNLPDIKEKE
mgnify:CR=1 FL=1